MEVGKITGEGGNITREGIVRDGTRFKYKLMGVMVYFYPAKNKHQSALRIRFPERAAYYENTRHYKILSI